MNLMNSETEWPSGLAAQMVTDGCGFEPKIKPPPMLTNMSVSKRIEKAWLPCWPLYSQQVLHHAEVNLRITQVRKHIKCYPPCISNPGQMSSEVQNRGISGSMKRTCVPKKFKKKNTIKELAILKLSFKRKSHRKFKVFWILTRNLHVIWRTFIQITFK